MEFFMDRSRNKKIAILGVTGSVGTQASDVAIARGYEVDLISANKDVEGALRAVKALKPRLVVMTDKDAANTLATALIGSGIKVMAGKDGLSEAIHATTAETVVNAIIGEAGLMPTLAVIDAGKRLALANKESLVIAGDIVTSRARTKCCSHHLVIYLYCNAFILYIFHIICNYFCCLIRCHSTNFNSVDRNPFTNYVVIRSGKHRCKDKSRNKNHT